MVRNCSIFEVSRGRKKEKQMDKLETFVLIKLKKI